MIKLFVFACIMAIVKCEIERTIFTISSDLVPVVLNAFEECTHDKDYTAEIIKRVRDGDTTEDTKFKDAIYCIWDKAEYIGKNGRLHIEKSAAVFPDKERMKAILTECDKGMGDDPRENAFKTYKCFQDTTPFRISVPLP